MDSKTFKIQHQPWLCVHPWTTTDFRAHADKVKITCCCNLDLGMIDHELDFSVLDHLRTTMAEKKISPLCHVCHRDEQAGQQSERVRNLASYPEHEIDHIAHTLDTGESQVLVKFSNKCSLACRSCSPDDSSLYATKFGDPTTKLLEQDLSDDPFYWSKITAQIESSRASGKRLIIQPIGGETLLQRGFHRLLDWMEEKDLARHATLRLTTSLAVNLSDELLAKLTRFKKITLMLSIDSVGYNYHCVRWPATFDRVERNLDQLLDMKKRHLDRLEFAITPVFSLNNIFYVDDYLDWWNDWAKRNQVDLWMYSIHLYNPDFLMVESIPDPYREPLRQLIGQVLNHEIWSLHARTYALRNYFHHMHQSLAHPPAADLFKAYLDYSARYDRLTGSDITRYNDRLFNHLDVNDQTHWNLIKGHNR